MFAIGTATNGGCNDQVFLGQGVRGPL